MVVGAQRWDPVVAATAITEALQVRTDAEQGLWCYDPQRGHYVDGERCEALIGRTLRWLVELWGPPTSRKGEVRKYGPNLRNEVRLILSEEPPSLVPGVPRNEFLLGFNNGILDVRKPEDGLTAHHPTSGITRVIPHDYNLDAEATLFLRLVAQVIPDEGERGLFQQACGGGDERTCAAAGDGRFGGAGRRWQNDLFDLFGGNHRRGALLGYISEGYWGEPVRETAVVPWYHG